MNAAAHNAPQREPTVSFVVPVHNAARFLGETLDAIYRQTYNDFEVIVVDDASTDAFAEVIAKHEDSRLRVIQLRENVGVSAARNLGIESARGQYIAFCDGDDLCMPERLDLQVRAFESDSELALCGGSFTCFDESERETVSHPQEPEAIARALTHGNCFGLSTVMVRSRWLKQHKFNISLGLAEDYDLWTRLLTAGARARNLPEVLLRYRLHPGQASRSKGEKLDLVAREVRARYCLRLLGFGGQGGVDALPGQTSTDLLEYASRRIEAFVAAHSNFVARDFRYMLAWIFQILPVHSWVAWWHWNSIQRRLDLKLDSTYRFNILVLTALPASCGRRHLAHLSKLKR